MDNLREKITHRFHLELALLQQRQSLQRTREDLRQTAFVLREAQIAQTEYDGSFRSLLDRLRGRREEQREHLSRQVRQEEGKRSALKALEASLARNVEELEQELEVLPAWEALGNEASGEDRLFWAERESRLCAHMLLPLLETVEAKLKDCRAVLRGEYAGQPMGHEERQTLLSAHIAAAESCAPLLDRLKKAMQDNCPEIGPYFENPAYYMAAAARHNQIDRVGKALDQTWMLRRALNALTEA